MPKVIISCAITGSIHTPSMSPHLPISASEIAQSAIEASEAGAAIVHLHARNPADGRPDQSPEAFEPFLRTIKQSSNVIVNLTTGGSPYMPVEQRILPALRLRPELASLNMGSMNFGLFPMLERYKTFRYAWEQPMLEDSHDLVFRNSFKDIRYALDSLNVTGARYEFECYDTSHLHNLHYFWKQGLVTAPLFIQTCFGLLGGIGAHPEEVSHMKRTADRLFEDNYHWSVLGAGASQMRVAAQAAAMGGHVRVGLEDNLWIGKGQLASSNAQQVAKVRQILEGLGLDIATPQEARAILGLKGVITLASDPIVVVGAGPVGMLLAAELGAREIPTIVLETKSGIGTHPRANTQGARSMEIYRRHGVSAKMRAAGLPRDRSTDVAYFTSFLGRELFRVALPSKAEAEAAARADDPRWPTPEPQYRLTQRELEPLLLDRLRQLPSVDLRFRIRVTGLVEGDDGVDLMLEAADGAKSTLRASYVVGCDGGRSVVRKAIGARFVGEDNLSMDFLGGRMLATCFLSPELQTRFPHADAWMHWAMQPGGRAILVTIAPERAEYLLHFQLKDGETAETIDFGARLATIVGESVSYQLVSQAEWRAGMGLVADSFGSSRCFLAGDAVHLFTPTGGFGLNTGIEDAFNLGWKVAMAWRGAAGPALLATYAAERRPVALRNTAYALDLARHNGLCPVTQKLDEDTVEGEVARAATIAHLSKFARWEFDTPGIQLGARYDTSEIIVSDGTSAPISSPTEYIPTTVPGGRLPHRWLIDGSSLFDRLGLDWTLIFNRTPAHTGLLEKWQDAAAKLSLDLTILQAPDVEVSEEADTLLVRPDQHIAWRGRMDADAARVLARACGHLCADEVPLPA